jgi:hypothetical protein
LLAIAESVPANLGRLGIRIVVPPPPTASTVTVDETEAIEMLAEQVHRGRSTAKRAAQFDLDSLTATYRLRTGRRAALETAQALFVTRNRALVRAARDLFPSGRVGTPIAMHASDLVTMAWLKKPRDAPNLPRLRLAADAYAASRPSPVLIERYTDVLMELRGRGNVSDAELSELRYATEAHTILMSKTRGDADRVDEPTVIEILEDTRRTLQESADATARVELEAVKLQLQQAQAATSEAEKEAQQQREAAKRAARAVTSARKTVQALRVVIGAVVAFASTAAAYFLWGDADTPMRRALLIAGAVLGITAAVAVALGRTRASLLLGAVALVVGLLEGLESLLST